MPSESSGIHRCQNQYVSPPAAAAHHATASENAMVPVIRPTMHQSTSSQDWASRSGNSALRQKPSSGRGHR